LCSCGTFYVPTLRVFVPEAFLCPYNTFLCPCGTFYVPAALFCSCGTFYAPLRKTNSFLYAVKHRTFPAVSPTPHNIPEVLAIASLSVCWPCNQSTLQGIAVEWALVMLSVNDLNQLIHFSANLADSVYIPTGNIIFSLPQ